MKLQSKNGSMVVDFYPTKTISGEVSKEWFVKTLSFCGETQSQINLNRIEMNLEIEEYLNNLTIPYEVVDFNVNPVSV
jgi:hypothetical protein